jgi:WD40 repeat protein
VVSAATIADPPFITGAWRPDAKAWATGGAAGEVTVVDAVTGATLARRPVGHQAVAALAYTPDGSRLVISEYHRLFVADSRTLRVTAGPFRIAKPIGWISPAPDNRHAFLTLGSPSRQWWRRPPTNSWAMVDLRDGAVGRTGRLSMEDSVVSTFAPSGDQVAVTGLSGQAELVDTASGQGTPLSSTADLGVIESATYNRDGTLLVTGASQQTAQLWDTRAGTLIGTVTVPTGVAAGAFRPDGSLAITSSDGLVYRWDPTLSHAVEYACRAAGRSLSATEWHQAFPMLPFRNVCP